MREAGKLFIDGYDAYTEYGVSVARYGYKQLIQMPSFKKLISTDWPEEDGEEVDLTSPELDTRSIQIDFNIKNIRYAEDLFDELRQGAYHEFYFTELKKTYRLRMTQNGKFSSLIKLGLLSLTFSDDFPSIPSDTLDQLESFKIWQDGYEIDNIAFSEMGIWVLDGTDDNIRKATNTKENLKVSTQNKAGVSYDDSEVYFKSKDVTISLLIDAPSIDEFWTRYDALFALLLQPESRTFYFATLGTEYDCHYKSTSVSKFDILRSGKVWCEFSVTLCFTSYHPSHQGLLLAHEDYSLVEIYANLTPALIPIHVKNLRSVLIHENEQYVYFSFKGKEYLIYLNN